MMMRPSGRCNASGRNALTLLEVVTAMGIFLVGVVALYELIQNATYRAMRVDIKAQASLRCQSKLAEVTVGAQELQSTDLQSFSDDDTWRWRLQVDEEFEGLARVRVEVQRELPNGEVIRSDLTQMVVPPTMRGSSLDVAPVAANPSSGSSGMGAGSSSGTSGTTGDTSGTTGGSTGATGGGSGTAGGGSGGPGGGSTGGATAPATPSTPPATTPTKGGGKR